ncbi:MAG: hypothetical protein IPM29_32525 [Planctomycetes bacterium]|nr:hypothetical protein [Planctomycetota bacterium]
MAKRLKSRLDRVARAVDEVPIHKDVLDGAFEHFRRTGELPEADRLAKAVINHTLSSARWAHEPLGPGGLLKWADEIAARLETLRSMPDTPGTPPLPPARERLLREAVHPHEIVRMAARACLQVCARVGIDVTARDFLDGEPAAEFGPTGLAMLGFPECLVRPPYVRQARRLIARLEVVRCRIDRSDPDWFDAFGEAILAFRDRGELPDAVQAREVALIDGEQLALTASYLGRGDAELIAAFDAVARARRSERAAATARLCELMRGGRLLAQLA